MQNNLPNQPSKTKDLVNKLTANPGVDVELNKDDVDVVVQDPEALLNEAKRLLRDKEREKFQKLRAEIVAAAERGEGAIGLDENEKMQELSRQIQAISDDPRTVAIEAGMSKIEGAANKGATVIEKIVDMGLKVWNSMSESLQSFILPLLPEGVANWLRSGMEPANIRRAMDANSKMKGKVKKTPDDAGFVKELRGLYDVKLQTVTNKETYSFETFYREKIAQLADMNQATYTIADLVNLPSPEKEAATKKENDEKDQKETTEKITKNVERTKAAHVYALARALNGIVRGALDLNEQAIQNDLALEAPTLYKTVAQNIITLLSAEKSVSTLGIDIDGGDLEEADGTNWFYDPDIVTYFEQNLLHNPEIAVRDLALANFQTGRSKTIMPEVQKKLREELKKYGIEISASAPAAPTPAAGQAPEETAQTQGN